MTRVRLTMLAVLAVMAVGAVTASGASAFTEFKETKAAPHKTVQKGSQKLTAEGSEGSKVVVTCEKVSGEAAFSKTELSGTPKYEECNVAGKAAKVTAACKIGTTIAGLANVGKGEGAKTCFTVETNDKSCKLIIKGEQLSKEKITYKNEGTSLVGEAAVKGLAFESSTGKACTFKNEAVTGTSGYSGNTITEGINVA